jgi:hypothetical protein
MQGTRNQNLAIVAPAVINMLASLLGSGSKSSGSASRGSSRRGSRGKKVSSKKGGMNPMDRSDLAIRPPRPSNVPRSVPRNLQSLISWDVVKFDQTLTSSSSAITESGFAAQFSNHPKFASWANLFDQYAIPMFSVEFDSECPPGYTNPPPVLYTAIDFDNTSPTGSAASMEDYSTCEYMVMSPGTRQLRSVRPCVRKVTDTGGSFSAVSVDGPSWIDTISSTVPHYGIRSLLGVSSGGTIQVQVTTTVWFCFRNAR